ncbi:mannose-6-phosphate isomerase, class I [Alkalicella caledoniensis]|uniref:mannose-6-phosphate isomerase n=1 Tax=Alkalicella caledoniensis TaxID=2731377 RepID=A0A7G9W7J6_ALKCA|nr:mannose-6-phosphate isomerase, class I [Alkalicella caledoniensis]QNO14658.1 mannose-6-phosphate isomerase, class I [Alkalicella caledoniensis]
MIKEIIFLEKIFHEKLWGGSKLSDYFGYQLQSHKTGECWAVSAHPNGDCPILNNKYKGKTLSWLWENEKVIFGDLPGKRFPLLTKLIDAKDDLSVQVHPDDNYAYKYEDGNLGKTECWYIVDCELGAELVLGHYAKDKEEMQEMIEKGLWDKLLRKVPIKPGDFFYIPAGTIHAIGKGTMILETQQSSDLTYRVYDYNRLEDGKLRKLHISKTLDVANAPHEDYPLNKVVSHLEQGVLESLVQEQYFSVYRIKTSGKQKICNTGKFKIVSVLSGSGYLDVNKIEKGDHFIIPHEYGDYVIEGDLELIISHV